LSGAGTVDGFGPASEVVGLIQDHAVTPCGAGSYSDSGLRRILEATATYRVAGQASGGIFAVKIGNFRTIALANIGLHQGVVLAGTRTVFRLVRECE
jgi:hypothetical protein